MRPLLSSGFVVTKRVLYPLPSRSFATLASTKMVAPRSLTKVEDPGPRDLPSYQDFQPEKKQILIRPFPKSSDFSPREIEHHLRKVEPPKGVEKEYFIKITSQILSLLRDEEKTLGLLREIEKDVAAQMQAAGFSADKINAEPQCLIAGQGCYVPGPPPEGHRASTEMYEAFNQALLVCERKYGINEEYDSVKVVGFSAPKILETVIKKGVVFSDDTQSGSALSHGEYSHRIQMLIVAKAIEKGLIDPSISKSTAVKPKGLPYLLSHSSGKSARNAWVGVFDNYLDMYVGLEPGSKDSLKPENFNQSFRSADVSNSILMCFGKELGLQFLSAGLLNAHWKSCQEIIESLKVKHPELKEMSDEILMKRFAATTVLDDVADAPESKFTKTREERIDELLKEGYTQMFGAKVAETMMFLSKEKPADTIEKPQAAPASTKTSKEPTM